MTAQVAFHAARAQARTGDLLDKLGASLLG
jgi:hypothetical protein